MQMKEKIWLKSQGISWNKHCKISHLFLFMLNLSYIIHWNGNSKYIDASFLFILCFATLNALSRIPSWIRILHLHWRKNKFHRRFDRSVLRCLSIVSAMSHLCISIVGRRRCMCDAERNFKYCSVEVKLFLPDRNMCASELSITSWRWRAL